MLVKAAHGRQWLGIDLTLVERETIVIGVAAGRGNRDIPRELGLFHKTVDQQTGRNAGRSNSSATQAPACPASAIARKKCRD